MERGRCFFNLFLCGTEHREVGTQRYSNFVRWPLVTLRPWHGHSPRPAFSSARATAAAKQPAARLPACQTRHPTRLQSVPPRPVLSSVTRAPLSSVASSLIKKRVFRGDRTSLFKYIFFSFRTIRNRRCP